MAVTQEELDSFNRFASEKLNNGGAESLLELIRAWNASQQAEDVASIQRGIDDADAGRMQSFEKVHKELRKKYDFPPSE